MQVHRRPAWLLAGSLLVAACGGGEGGEPDAAPTTTDAPRRATTSTSPSTSSTTSSAPTTTTSAPAVDPSVIPEDPAAIDEAYVEAVANELYRVLGEATRGQRNGVGLDELTGRFDAVYDPDLVNSFLNSALEDEAEGFPDLRLEPGNARVSVRNVRQASEACISADVVLSVDEVVETPVLPFEGVLILRPLDRSNDPQNFNPTPWVTEGVAAPEEFSGVDPCT